MKIAASIVVVLVLLVLVQCQQTKPSVTAESGTSEPKPLLQDDIHVKPRGLAQVGAYWTCTGRPCEKGDEKWLRDDLFEALSYLDMDMGEKKLDGIKFILAEDGGDVEISIERNGTFFVWTADGQPLEKGYKVCKHANPKNCNGSGIPASWMDKLKKISVRYECTKDYIELTENEDVHLQGRPSAK